MNPILQDALFMCFLVFAVGFAAGHGFTLSWVARRFRTGIAYQLRREQRRREMDAEDAFDLEQMDRLREAGL